MTPEEKEAKVRALKLVLVSLLCDDAPAVEIAAVQAIIAVVQGQPICVRNLTRTLETLGMLAQDFNDTIGFAEAVQSGMELIMAHEPVDAVAALSIMPQMVVPQFPVAWQRGDLTHIL